MWKNCLEISHSEQKGTLLLLAILIFLILMNIASPLLFSQQKNSDLIERIEQFNRETAQKPFVCNLDSNSVDINTTSLDTLRLLGFKDNDIRKIDNYRQKGGRYHQLSDVYKIYGVDSSIVQQMTPYLSFKTSESHQQFRKEYQDGLKNDNSSQQTTKKKYATSKEIYYIEINSADTAVLTVLPGIGHGRASQIVYYRNQLGGFLNLEQLLEIDNFTNELFQDIKPHLTCNPQLLVPININKVSLKRLNNHPYINFYQAKEIYELRTKLKHITSKSQIWKLSTFNTSDTLKISPYIIL